MKKILSILLSLSVLCASLAAVEYGQLYSVSIADPASLEPGTFIELETGDIFTPLSLSEASTNPNLRAYNGTQKLYVRNFASIFAQGRRPEIVGPCRVWVYSSGSDGADAISYKLTRASEVEYKQANIVSLPADTVGAGTHEIVVEASDDLQSWTPVHSSSIGGNKAFFRTRVVRTGE